MKKHYYNADSLRRLLARLEDMYGMRSDEFFEAHRDDRVTVEISGFHRHVWASTYRDVRRIEAEGFAERAARVLAI